MENNSLTQENASTENEKVGNVFNCGACQLKCNNIYDLHKHLTDHIEGGSYHFDNNSKTAFPKYDAKCSETQTDNQTETINLLYSCALNSVETQTIDRCELKCVEEQTHKTCLTDGYNDYVNGNPNYHPSLAIKTEPYDLCTNMETDSLNTGFKELLYPGFSMPTNDILVIKEEVSLQQHTAESAQEMYGSDIQRKIKSNEEDRDWTPTAEMLDTGRPHNARSIFRKQHNKNKGKKIKEKVKISLKPKSKYPKTDHVTDEDLKYGSSDTDDYTLAEDQDLNSTKPNKPKRMKREPKTRQRKKVPKHCTKCDIFFPKMDLFKKHLCDVHGENPWICSYCMKSYTTKDELTSHKKDEHSEDVLQCNICGIFLCSQYLKRHRIEQHFTELAEYRCLECNKQYIRKGDYQAHMDGVHSETPQKSICETCGFQAANPRSLGKHKEQHNTERVKKYSCTECPFKSYVKDYLFKHMTIHTGKRDYICYVCGKSFRNSGSLAQHIRVHTGEKPYKCERCPKAFANHSSFRRHKEMHNEKKKHTCPYCGKTFVQNTNCKAHMRQHTGEKPYICDLCGAGFTHNVSRKNHIMKAHP